MWQIGIKAVLTLGRKPSRTGRFKVYKLLQKPLLYEPWYFLLYYISIFAIRLYLGAYFKDFVLIFTSWFVMLLELSLITFLRDLKKSLRIVTPSIIRAIVSQVESMIELCIFIVCWIVIMLMIVLNLCNDCNDLVGCSSFFKLLKSHVLIFIALILIP